MTAPGWDPAPPDVDEDEPPLLTVRGRPASPRPGTHWNPGQGWAHADLARRTFAVSAVVVLPVLALSGLLGWGVLVLALTVAPPACYSLARVLRPSWALLEGAPRSLPDAVRHWFAAIATAFATPILGGLALDDALGATGDAVFAAMFWLGIPAFALGVVSLVWGVGTHVVRLVDRRWPSGQ